MTVALDLAVRSSLLVGLGLLTAACLTRRSAALRHCVLAASIFAAALVVPLSLVIPAWDVVVPAAQPSTGVATAGPAAPPAARTVPRPAAVPAPAVISRPAETAPAPLANPSRWFTLIWCIGFVAMASRLGVGVARVRRIASGAVPVRTGTAARVLEDAAARFGIRRSIVLLHGSSARMLATWGVRPPRVLLPADAVDWSDDRLHVVLRHELAHVRRHDWLVQIAAEAVCALFWFNPLMWLACARLRDESERACDDLVLGTGIGARAYAGHLLELARMCRGSRSAWVPAMPIAQVSTLERRIAAMLNPSLNRRALSPRSAAATALVIAALALPAAALRAVQGGPLSGSIYDATGAVLPGVQVVLKDAGGTESTATTNASGRFQFPGVNAGSYLLTASLPGFKALRQDVELARASDWDRVITLQVGQVQETITISASRVVETSPQPGGTPPRPVRVGGNIRAPRKLVDVKPIYPTAMRAAGREGVVPIEALIGVDGAVTSVRVVSAQVHPDFAIAAADAVRQWRFSPTLLNGTPVEVMMTVTVAFKLAD